MHAVSENWVQELYIEQFPVQAKIGARLQKPFLRNHIEFIIPYTKNKIHHPYISEIVQAEDLVDVTKFRKNGMERMAYYYSVKWVNKDDPPKNDRDVKPLHSLTLLPLPLLGSALQAKVIEQAMQIQE